MFAWYACFGWCACFASLRASSTPVRVIQAHQDPHLTRTDRVGAVGDSSKPATHARLHHDSSHPHVQLHGDWSTTTHFSSLFHFLAFSLSRFFTFSLSPVLTFSFSLRDFLSPDPLPITLPCHLHHTTTSTTPRAPHHTM
jgi:hypothetical protein